MPDKTSFCECIVLTVCYVNKDKRHVDMIHACDNNNAIITNSFDDFTTRSFSNFLISSSTKHKKVLKM